MEYPIKKYDELKRMIYVDWNGVERCLNIYWDDTEKIKIKYRFWNQDVEVEAYDKNGKIIIKIASGRFSVNFPKLRMENERVKYIVDKKNIESWMKKLDCEQ